MSPQHLRLMGGSLFGLAGWFKHALTPSKASLIMIAAATR